MGAQIPDQSVQSEDALQQKLGAEDQESARLRQHLAEARQREAELLDQQTATAEILRAIASASTGPQLVLDAVARNATRVCGAEDALIRLIDGDGLRLAARYGSVPGSDVGEILPLSRASVAGRAVLDRGTVHIRDLSEESEQEFREALRPTERRFGVRLRTMLATPLVREGVPIGAILIRRVEVRPFTDRQIAMLETFADQAVIAIENARLLQELQARTAELAELNRTLEARVTEQVEQLERVGRLRRYLSPQLADLIISSGDESILENHRRQITVVFCDLRGFTAFAETAEPEEVMSVLSEYHAAMGALIHDYGGTLDRFAGDGLMVIFNDPLPQPDHAERAVRMACAMRDRAAEMAHGWRRQGHELGVGIGIAVGYATLGRIGFEGRSDYTAIGTVTNLAARLCGEAAAGQVVIHGRVHSIVEELVEAESLGELVLKGLHRPVAAFNVLSLRDA